MLDAEIICPDLLFDTNLSTNENLNIEDVEMICPDLLFDTNLSTSENLNVEVANFLSKEAIYRANNIKELPTIGSKVILYVINNKDLYVWNTQTKKYDLLNFSQEHLGDGLITVFQNGAAVGSFSLNQALDADIELTTPTKVSELDNDSNYISENEKENIDIDFSEYFN